MKHLALAAAIAMAATQPAQANALMPEYAIDKEDIMILDGYIKEIDWSGDRLKLTFFWKNGYGGMDWVLYGPPPEDLFRMGWTRDILAMGDTNTMNAVIHPDREGGTETGELLRFQFNDGRTLETSIFGSTQVIPRRQLERVFENIADDPMGGLYFNTQDFYAEDPDGPKEANYGGRVWYNVDHTLTMFSIDMDDEGKFQRSLNSGIWWLQEWKGKWTRCMIFNFARRPYCHSPTNFEKVGDKWSIDFDGRTADWVEHREIQPGRN